MKQQTAIPFALSLVVALFLAALFLAACAPDIPQEALTLTPQSESDRDHHSRRFAASDETQVLTASAAVLKDLGFSIDTSVPALGLLVGSKVQDVSQTTQLAQSLVIAMVAGVYVPSDDQQKIRASLVTTRLDHQDISVRLTFQQMTFDTRGQISTSESLVDQALYRQFFARLAETMALPAEKI